MEILLKKEDKTYKRLPVIVRLLGQNSRVVYKIEKYK